MDDPLTDEEIVVKTEAGHQLLLPKDWPVERKDGLIAPVSVEQYLSMKFSQVREKFEEMTNRLEALERRLQQTEAQDKALQLRMRLLEAQGSAQEERDGHTSQAR